MNEATTVNIHERKEIASTSVYDQLSTVSTKHEVVWRTCIQPFLQSGFLHFRPALWDDHRSHLPDQRDLSDLFEIAFCI